MIKEIVAPHLKNPICIASWPGMGEVSYKASIFLKEALDFKKFAQIDSSDYFTPAGVIVKDGLAEIPKIDAGSFYYAKVRGVPDIILFLADAQPSLEKGFQFSVEIINYLKKFKPKVLISFAAMPTPMEHSQAPGVWAAASTDKVLSSFIKEQSVKKLQEGHISGLNGLILGIAKQAKIDSLCLLGEIPLYAIQIENPKASKAVLEIVDSTLGLRLNFTPLDERIQVVSQEIDKLINYIKTSAEGGSPVAPAQQSGEHTPLNEDDVEKIKKDLAAYSKLPESARERIDTLFKTAEVDISKASELKKELDQWNVYKEYEDRFLDLFKKNRRDH